MSKWHGYGLATTPKRLWILATHLVNGFAQGFTHIVIAQKTAPTIGDDSEKVSCALRIGAPKVRHGLLCGSFHAWATCCPPYNCILCGIGKVGLIRALCAIGVALC